MTLTNNLIGWLTNIHSCIILIDLLTLPYQLIGWFIDIDLQLVGLMTLTYHLIGWITDTD